MDACGPSVQLSFGSTVGSGTRRATPITILSAIVLICGGSAIVSNWTSRSAETVRRNSTFAGLVPILLHLVAVIGSYIYKYDELETIKVTYYPETLGVWPLSASPPYGHSVDGHMVTGRLNTTTDVATQYESASPPSKARIKLPIIDDTMVDRIARQIQGSHDKVDLEAENEKLRGEVKALSRKYENLCKWKADLNPSDSTNPLADYEPIGPIKLIVKGIDATLEPTEAEWHLQGESLIYSTKHSSYRVHHQPVPHTPRGADFLRKAVPDRNVLWTTADDFFPPGLYAYHAKVRKPLEQTLKRISGLSEVDLEPGPAPLIDEIKAEVLRQVSNLNQSHGKARSAPPPPEKVANTASLGPLA
jgi:hypothetical protein